MHPGGYSTGLSLRSFLPCTASLIFFFLFSCSFACTFSSFLMSSQPILSFLHFVSILGILLYLLYSFQFSLIVRILGLFSNIFVEIKNA
jgi:hypothetical protein